MDIVGLDQQADGGTHVASTVPGRPHLGGQGGEQGQGLPPAAHRDRRLGTGDDRCRIDPNGGVLRLPGRPWHVDAARRRGVDRVHQRRPARRRPTAGPRRRGAGAGRGGADRGAGPARPVLGERARRVADVLGAAAARRRCRRAARGWLPLLAGVAVASGACGPWRGVDAVLKWPNDVLAGDRKLAGHPGRAVARRRRGGDRHRAERRHPGRTRCPVSPAGLAATSLLAEGADGGPRGAAAGRAGPA